MGLRLQALDGQACVTRLTLGWRNRNPFGSMYFAAQLAAAEMASGLPAFLAVRRCDGRVSMLVTRVDAQFHRKAAGRVHFTFEGVMDLQKAIAEASRSDEPVFHEARIKAWTIEGEPPVSTFCVQWRFRARVNAP